MLPPDPSVNAEAYRKENAYRIDERLGMICEDSKVKGGQRKATEKDIEQAKREVTESMDELEADEHTNF